MQNQSSRILTKCPLCQAVYSKDAIQLVKEQGPARLFHCTCTACGHTILALVLEASGWVSSVGLVTDLEIADALLFQSASSITLKECVALKQALDQQSRDFCQLLLG